MSVITEPPAPMPAGTPLASVVISVKDRQALLAECLTALGAQTLGRDRFEVVVVDNVSRDDIAAVCEEARRTGLDIRCLRMETDRGPAPARNRGVAVARAPVIAFTDSDCRPEPQWLERALAAFEDPAVAFVTGPVLPKPEQRATLSSKLTFVTAGEHPTFPTANMVMRTAVFRRFGGFDESLSFRDPLDRATECADTDLAWRVIKGGHARRFVPEAVMRHEIENQPLLHWVLEPTRLFLLPALVRRHPELRSALLTAGVFFYPPMFLLYAAALMALAAVLWQPWLLALLPVALVARGIQRTGSLDPLVLAAHAGRVLAHLPRMLVMSLSLIYGSLRFKALVL